MTVESVSSSPTLPSIAGQTKTPQGLSGGDLIKLLNQQRDLYLQLKALGDQQGALIAQRATDPLLRLLAQRQRLVNALGQLNGKLAPYRQHMAALASTLQATECEHPRALVAAVDGLLGTIIKQDDRDHHELRSTCSQVGAELKQVNRTSAALSAYRSPAAPQSARITDRQG